MFNIKNIWKGWVESLIGLAVIATSLYLAATGKSDWTQTIVGVTFGCLLMGIKINGNTNTATMCILFCLANMACHSLKNPTAIQQKGVIDSVTYVPKLVNDTVFVPGDTINVPFHIPCPELGGKTWQFSSRKGSAKATLKVDTNLVAHLECDCSPYTEYIKHILFEREHYRKETMVLREEVKKPVPKAYRYALYLDIAILAALILYGGFKLYKAFKPL